MKVVLVAIHPYPSPQAVPLGNAFLKAYLNTDEALAGNLSVTLYDFFIGEKIEDSLSALLAGVPDAVGFSVYLWNRKIACDLANMLRQANPQLVIFAGGVEPTADPEGFLHAAAFDFLILGEGEIPFVEAMAALSAGKGIRGVKGCASLQEGVFTGCRGIPVGILDTMPSPYLSGIIGPVSGGGVLWQISRGCDFGCDFCFDAQGVKGVRRFSMSRVKAELQWFVKNEAAQVFVIDSTFNQDIKRAKEILRLIDRVAPHIHFHFEVRCEFIDAEMARLFARLNCSLQVGLQSAHPQVHKMVRRIFNADEFSRKIALLNQAGAVFGFDLIYGLPGDSMDGFSASIDFALLLYPNHLDIFPLAILPGTVLATKADDYGLCYLKDPPYTLQSSPTFPAGDMQDAASLAAACDIFYSRGKAVAWFNSLRTPSGLSPSSFLRAFQSWLVDGKGCPVTESDMSDQDIWQAQRAFITRLYTEIGLCKLLPAALDQIDYHWHYAAALLAVQPEIPTDHELEQTNFLDCNFRLSPSSTLARFNFEIFDILQAGEIDLEGFVDCFTPSGSYAVIYPRGDEIFTESLIAAHYAFLSLLDGTIPPRQIATSLHIPNDEAASFLEFAASEGIICKY